MVNKIFNRIMKLSKEQGKNVVFVAIDHLRLEEDIKAFFEGYISLIMKVRKWKDREKAKKGAISDVGYILGYYDKETEDRWHKALPEVYHPFFIKAFR